MPLTSRLSKIVKFNEPGVVLSKAENSDCLAGSEATRECLTPSHTLDQAPEMIIKLIIKTKAEILPK